MWTSLSHECAAQQKRRSQDRERRAQDLGVEQGALRILGPNAVRSGSCPRKGCAQDLGPKVGAIDDITRCGQDLDLENAVCSISAHEIGAARVLGRRLRLLTHFSSPAVCLER